MTKTNWTIKFRWVKAHAGIRGNELADTSKGSSDKRKQYRKLTFADDLIIMIKAESI